MDLDLSAIEIFTSYVDQYYGDEREDEEELDEETMAKLREIDDSIPEFDSWAKLRFAYLREEKLSLLLEMIADGTLKEHLEEVENRYSERLSRMVENTMENDPAMQRLKDTNPLEWAGLCKNYESSYREILTEEVCQ